MTENMVIGAVVGGALCGLAAGGMLWLNGRIAGNSGIVAGAIERRGAERLWRLAWLAGLLAGGAILVRFVPSALATPPPLPTTVVVAAGALVGFGTRLGNGCTSGHGLCGVGRLSPRSLAATTVFMVVGALTVALTRMLGGVS